MTQITLASTSQIRASMLAAAGVPVRTEPARIDEEAVRAALEAEGSGPRDIADVLAEMKAARVSHRHPDDFVIGCDQILVCDGQIYSKPDGIDAARAQLRRLRGRKHTLFSAVVLYHQRRPEWRHVGEASLTMRDFSDAYLESYLQRNQACVTSSVGGYMVEQEGIRLFSAIDGDHFTILGMPLLPLLAQLGIRGVIEA